MKPITCEELAERRAQRDAEENAEKSGSESGTESVVELRSPKKRKVEKVEEDDGLVMERIKRLRRELACIEDEKKLLADRAASCKKWLKKLGA